MGTQTMGTNSGTEKPMFDQLSRQGSLYNLTLDEVQQQLGDLGKPFSSMNLDELLKTVYTAENQGISSKPQLDSGLTKKTVDEVWQDIQQGQKMKNNDSYNKDNNDTSSDTKRQTTLGEMTLEDFLVKAGIVAESSSPEKKNQELSLVPQETQWINYEMPVIQQQSVVIGGHYQGQQPISVGGKAVMDAGYTSPTPFMGTLANPHLSGRKRFASGDVVEKTVERRQKRMIKNRESAARSRARKQAYTNELENKISRLEDENERLRREKEVEKVLPPPEPKYELRRTTSASF